MEGGLGDGDRERDLRPADMTDRARSRVLGLIEVVERLSGDSEGPRVGLPITGELEAEFIFVDLRLEEVRLEVDERPVAGGIILNHIGRREGLTGIRIKAWMICVKGATSGIGNVGGIV